MKDMVAYLPDLGAHVPVRRGRVWGGLQAYLRIRERRAMAYRAWQRGTLTSIRRLDGSTDYASPGDYTVTTAFGDSLRVILSNRVAVNL